MKNKNWWKAAAWRALRTVAQTALATIGSRNIALVVVIQKDPVSS